MTQRKDRLPLPRGRGAWILPAVVLSALLLLPGCSRLGERPTPAELGYDVLHRDTVWKARKGPYRLTRSLLVAPGTTLTIRPGVEVLLGPDVSIFCQGRIVAEGEPDRPVRFRPLGEAPWNKIEFLSGQLSPDRPHRENVFRHCVIEGGEGLRARDNILVVESCVLRGNVDTPVSLEFSAGRIVGNRIYGNSTEKVDTAGNGGGIVVYSDREVLVADNDVHDNVSMGGRDGGGGIYAYAYDRGKISVVGNRIWRNRSDRFGGGLVAFQALVKGNLILENRADHSGGGVFAVGGAVEGNRIEWNESARGGGIYAENSLVRGNTIAYNAAPPSGGGGLFYYGEGKVVENVFYANGAPRGDGPGEAVVVSGNPLFTRNNLVGGRDYALRVQTHRLAPDLEARENFWGTRDPLGVAARIHDWLDDTERGLVKWRPFRDGWVPETPPPPPDFLLWRRDGEAWILSWEYPVDVPISGFLLHWREAAGGPISEGRTLGGRLRSVRLSPPSPGAVLLSMSAYREGEDGRRVESGLSAWVRVPRAAAGEAPSASVRIEPLRPRRVDAPPLAIPALQAISNLPDDQRTGARWVISEVPVDFSLPLFDSGPVDGSETLPLPERVLQPGRGYAWRVAFQGRDGTWTDWSPTVRFRTAPEDPALLHGTLSKDRVLGGGPERAYRVTGNVFVPAGRSLEILPGTRLTVSPGVDFRIRGRLVAKGRKGRPIRFTGDRKAPWGRLFIEGRSDGEGSAEGDGDAGREQAVLEHCIVENGHGILVEAAPVRVADSLVRWNHDSGIALRNTPARILRNRILENESPSNGGGIYAYGSRFMYILENEIVGNRAAEDGGGVFGYGYHSNTAVNLSRNRIEGNRCGGSGGGAWLSRAALVDNRVRENRAGQKGGGVYATFALIKDNEISGNRAAEGGGVFAETNSTLERNRIVGNRASGEHGGGVYLNFWGMSIKNEVFRGNLVTKNRAAGPEAVGGLYLNGAMIFEYNRIYGNAGIELFNANPSDRSPLSAPHCYWGSRRAQAIEAAIHDGADDPGLARVEFRPFAPTPERARPPAAGR